MPDLEWLTQVEEETIDPDQPVCDPHHHLWDFPGSRYLLEEFRKDTQSGHKIVSTVFVECATSYRRDGSDAMKPIGETEFVTALTEDAAGLDENRTAVAAGIIGFADLTLGLQLPAVLDAHESACKGRFRGIRHAMAWHASDSVNNAHSQPHQGLMEERAFIEGLKLLGDRDLIFEAWLYHDQLPQFIELAKSAPKTRIVLNHFGGPLGVGPYKDCGDVVFNAWSNALSPLSDCENVYCKMGGVNMKMSGYGWHKRTLPPTSDELVNATERYYHRAIEVFGAERCMFESNFPMDRESCSYHVLWNTFKKIASRYSFAERDNLLRSTAEGCYRIQS